MPGEVDSEKPAMEHVAIFDEAQRAWNLKQTVDFMRQKKGRADFKQSEPEFLISCLDRHEGGDHLSRGRRTGDQYG
jgi:Uncharacterized conserved protein (DUF2075)